MKSLKNIYESDVTKDREYQIKTKHGMRIAVPKGKKLSDLKSVLDDTDHVLEPYDKKYFKLADDIDKILDTISGRKDK